MLELSKIEVIDLINNINIDGVDNTMYSLAPVTKDTDSTAVFGGDEGLGVTLTPGAYLAIRFRDTVLEAKFPRIYKYANVLGENKFELVPDNDGEILIFLLDRFGV